MLVPFISAWPCGVATWTAKELEWPLGIRSGLGMLAHAMSRLSVLWSTPWDRIGTCRHEDESEQRPVRFVARPEMGQSAVSAIKSQRKSGPDSSPPSAQSIRFAAQSS